MPRSVGSQPRFDARDVHTPGTSRCRGFEAMFRNEAMATLSRQVRTSMDSP